MKNNAFYPFLLVCCLLFSSATAFAFQLADGSPPSLTPAAKYIFYWGQHQCDLSEANAYKGNLTLSPGEFRQVLVGAPKVWNGKELVKNVTFKLENLTVSADEYLGQLAQLDAQLGPKAQSGKLLHLTELTLDDGVLGSIDINIEEPENKDNKTLFGNASSQRNTFLNDQFLDRAVWGREDIYENSNRDYFTVREFWQTIRQEPAVEWKSYLKPQLLRSEVTFLSKDKTSFSVVERLEEGAYRGMLENLENYRHMVHPGAIITLQLQTAEQYDLLYKKTMNIVADDDPRLRLRRKRDQHKLKIQWGDWAENVPELYLTHLTNPQGESVPTDSPIARNASFSFPKDRQLDWGQNKPQCWIDDEPVSGNIAFRVALSDSLVFQVNSSNYSAEPIQRYFAPEDLNFRSLIIDSIQIDGFDLPPMAFFIYLIKSKASFTTHNDLGLLQSLSTKPALSSLSPPVIGEKDLEFSFELPEISPVVLSIFEPEGWLVVEQDDSYGRGRGTMKVARTVFRNKGKHLAFLSTGFGVSKVEFTIE